MNNGAPMPIGRYEWERLVRRIVMPGPHKLVALTLATYADPDGTRVRPGLEILADDTEQSTRNTKRIIAALLKLQLIQQVSRGGGRGGAGKATTYRLTVPDDLLERVELRSPNGRTKPDSGATQMASQNGSAPVDNDQSSVDNEGATAQAPSIEGTSNTVTKPIEGTFSANEGTPGCPTTTHVTKPPRPTPVVTTQRKSRPRRRARDPPRTTRPAPPYRPAHRPQRSHS